MILVVVLLDYLQLLRLKEIMDKMLILHLKVCMIKRQYV